MKNRNYFFFVFLLIFIMSPINFLCAEEPVWLLLERGRQSFEKGSYGEASRIFREVLERDPQNADAEVWLAQIFEKEGEYILAEKQYLNALEKRNNLYIIDNYTDIYYRLAEIYRLTDQYGNYEKTLLTIINEAVKGGDLNLQYSMNDTIKQEGFDKAFELYRYENTKYNKARTELGIFLYKTGRYTEAENNLILPVISILTTGYNYIYNRTAKYEYSDVESHLKVMLNYEDLSDFINKNMLFETMYYLAASFYADGYPESAIELWELVVRYDSDESPWKIRSERQLYSPFIEPIIKNRS